MIWWVFVLMGGAIVLDQLSKWLAVVFLKSVDTVPLWEGVLHLTYHENPGAAFGILTEHRWVFMVISTVAIIALCIYLGRFRPKNFWVKLSLGMIVGGGIGNMIDRTFLGYVIDFIDFRLINFAIFNVADSFITVGAGVMMVYLINDLIREMKAEKAKKLAAQMSSDAEESTKESSKTEESTEDTSENG